MKNLIITIGSLVLIGLVSSTHVHGAGHVHSEQTTKSVVEQKLKPETKETKAAEVVPESKASKHVHGKDHVHGKADEQPAKTEKNVQNHENSKKDSIAEDFEQFEDGEGVMSIESYEDSNAKSQEV